MPGPPFRVLVLYGGTSAERAVSLQSGAAVAEALAKAGYRVQCLDPARCDLSTVDFSRFDVVFPMLHGTFGEDGRLQRLLRRRGVAFVGSDEQASELAFHKSRAKGVWQRAGLPTPRFVVIDPRRPVPDPESLAGRLRPPWVVKPDAQGSSVGVSVRVGPDELADAVSRARAVGEVVLVEEYVPGDEWTVALFDGRPFPPIRIRPSADFYDYHAKYESERTVFEVTPTDVPRERLDRLQQLSVRAADMLGVRGISRVDLRVDPEGTAWLLEVNTIPGMTTHSLVPMAARAAGWSLDTLCDRAVQNALRGCGRIAPDEKP